MNNTRDGIKLLIAQSLGLDITDVEENKHLNEDLGLADTEVAQIWEVIQNKYGFTPPEEDKNDARTIGELLDLVEQYATA